MNTFCSCNTFGNLWSFFLLYWFFFNFRRDRQLYLSFNASQFRFEFTQSVFLRLGSIDHLLKNR